MRLAGNSCVTMTGDPPSSTTKATCPITPADPDSHRNKTPATHTAASVGDPGPRTHT